MKRIIALILLFSGLVFGQDKPPIEVKPGGIIEAVFDADTKATLANEQVKVDLWNGETSLQFGAPVTKGVQPTIKGDVVEWDSADSTTRIYTLPPTGQMALGGIEYEIVLKVPPLNNQFEFAIDTTGLDFWYQPVEYSKYELDHGAFRPDNIKGSFAVYSSSKRNNKYKTGKVADIFRPTATDATGDAIWGVWSLGINSITATFDAGWLDKAVYPVTIGPTIGTNPGAPGGTTANFGPNSLYTNGRYPMPTNGTCDALYFYTDGTATSGSTLGLYDDNSGVPDALVGETAEFYAFPLATAWFGSAVSCSLTSGAYYWPAINNGTASLSIYYDLVSSFPNYASSTYSAGALDDPFPSTTSDIYQLSLYLDYTSTGGGGPPPTTSLMLTGVGH